MTLAYDDIILEMIPYVEINSLYTVRDIKNSLSESTIKYVPSNNRISSNVVVYNNVFGLNNSIVYTPTFSGFKEDIVLSAPPTSNQFTFILNLSNALLENKSSHIEIINTNSDVIGVINPITVISSNDLFSDGYYIVEERPGDNENIHSYTVTLVVDSVFLSSVDVEYPVTIDPSVTIYAVSGSTKQIYDATLYQNQSNFATGTIQYNNVGYLTNDSYGHSRSIMKFPTLENDFTFGAIPNNLLTSVNLHMYCVSATNSTTVTAYQYTGSNTWTESNVTSGLSSSINSSIASSPKTVNSGSSSSPTKYIFNITSIAKEWKSNRSLLDYGILFKNSNESNINYGVRFASSDASSNKPYLVYTYSQTTSFSLKSVYSNNFNSSVGSSYASSYINSTMSFIDDVFSSTFGVSFTTSSPTLRTSSIDECPNNDSECTTSACGSNCATSHHRNATRYSNEVHDLVTSANQIYIAWDYTSRNSICDLKNNVHSPVGAMALVNKMPDSGGRGVYYPTGQYYWDGMNVIPIFQPWLSSSYKLPSMKLVAAHEMAHVLGIHDTYNNPSLTDHGVNDLTWNCLMRSFNYSAAGEQFVQEIEAGTAAPFCDYCENLLSTVVKLRYFPAS